VADDKDFNRMVRRTAFTAVALVFGLVFGVLLMAGGDWVPGGIIVAAALIGLAVEIPVIAKLCARPTGGSYRRRSSG
jgi:alpha-D-ribose 1-methylphosphonate 5-phosphate C-P lyase